MTEFPEFRWPELCDTSAFLGEITQLMSEEDNLILEVLQMCLALVLKERRAENKMFALILIFVMSSGEDVGHETSDLMN